MQKSTSQRGLRAYISRKCGIPKSTISDICNGKRRATTAQAALMEGIFIQRSVPLNRWDLLYGVDVDNGETLDAYIVRKKSE